MTAAGGAVQGPGSAPHWPPFGRSPSFSIALVIALTPVLATAQYRAMVPASVIAFVIAIAAHWRNNRRLPWPRPAPVLLLSGALLLWALVTASWSTAPDWGVLSALRLLALVLLAAMTARALEQDAVENIRWIGIGLIAGLILGIAVLAFDQASGHLFRLAVRAFPAWENRIAFGLKPAVSVLALVLPLVLAVPRLSWRLRLSVLLPGAGVAVWLPGESAKIATLTGLLVGLSALYAPRLVARALAVGLAALFLLAPMLFAAALSRAPDLSAFPVTATHRLLIWDFTIARIAERPLLGWGAEASRAMPGGAEPFDDATRDRFGLTSEQERVTFGERWPRLVLHPHNAALQIRLETGLVGTAIAAALGFALARAADGSAGALGALAAATVTGQLSFGAWQPWWVASLVFVAVAAAALQRLSQGEGRDTT